LITRIKDITRFAALTPDINKILLYTLYQIPHILPIAIPISCLISSFLLFQKFSRTSELTALRSSGLSIKKIIFPVVTISLFISFINFFINSEITPYCRIHSKKIAHVEITLNPIMLLERQQLLKIKNAFIDLITSSDSQSAKDVIFIAINKSNSRLNLLTAKDITLKKDTLLGNNISLITNFQGDPCFFDTLIIENQEKMSTKASNLSKYMKSSSFSLNTLQLPTKMLIVRNKLEKTHLKQFSPLVEIIRRAALSLSAFSFTFIGIGFGIEISRSKSKKKLLIASICALLILVSFAVGKGLKYHPFISSLIYIIPQPLILLFSIRSLQKISGGQE
jgi:lipopolysaccharide export system permease protein